MAVKPIQTILLVDSHKLVLRALHSTWKKRGYNVLEANDGEEALLIAECFPETIHVLVTDLVKWLDEQPRTRAAPDGIYGLRCK